MNYEPEVQIKTARRIARSAQQIIKNKTGMRINLLLCSHDDMTKTPERMLKIIAIALNMSPRCFKMKSRMRDIVELRFLGAIFLRMHFPKITLHQIAELFGGQDHSSIISGITRANNLIHTGDLRFIAKYNSALNAVNLWLNKEVLEYETAFSA